MMTPDERYRAILEDLRTDIRCAERDGLSGYAEECRKKLQALQAERAGGKSPQDICDAFIFGRF